MHTVRINTNNLLVENVLIELKKGNLNSGSDENSLNLAEDDTSILEINWNLEVIQYF